MSVVSDPIELLMGERRSVVFQKGQRIFGQGKPAEALFFIRSGCVRLVVEDALGDRHIVGFLFAGELLYGGLTTHWATAEAVSTCAIASSPMDATFRLLAEDQAACAAVVCASQRMLSELARQMTRLVNWSATDRVVWLLERLAQHSRGQAANELELLMGRKDLADFLGLAPETVSRTLAQLEASGELSKLGPRRYRWAPRGRDGRPAATTEAASEPALAIAS